MTDLQQPRHRKMRKITEIKQELSNSEEDEGDFVKSITSLNLANSQTGIKQEENSISEAEDSVQLNKTTSLTYQVKTEPESEEDEDDGCGLESTARNYLDGFVIKREIIEVHTEDQHMMDNEENHKQKMKDEDSGTEAVRIVKPENDNWPPNFPETNIDEQNNTFDQTKKQISGRIGDEIDISLTQAKTLHQTNKSHKYSVCAKAFRSSQACLQHIWNTHKGENPYMCEVCGKSFKYLKILQVHQVVHSDERPFSCDVCNKAFKYKSVLQNHKVSCHSNERPYSCDVCEKTFKLKEHLYLHTTKVHSDERPYSCDMCNKTFKRKGVLQTHKMSYHSNERPYSCDLCDKAFKRNSILRRHKVSCHFNERPYSCDVCKKTFKRKGHLDSHKWTVHSDGKLYLEMYVKRAFKQSSIPLK